MILERMFTRLLSRVCHLVVVVIAAFPMAGLAHIGSNDVFFEGRAGGYPVRINVRMPGVIPGRAEISVRVTGGVAERVTVVPVRWDVGLEGSPSPDGMKPVPGSDDLFSAEAWLMKSGAHSIYVGIDGDLGEGKVAVPVNAVATSTLPMPAFLKVLLGVLGSVILLLAAGIFYGAVREAVVAPGVRLSLVRRVMARIVFVAVLGGLSMGVVFGKKWWDHEEMSFRNNRLYQPVEAAASVSRRDGMRVLELVVADEEFRRSGPLVPDHGKLMHLYLIEAGSSAAFAHLHPVRLDRGTFDVVMPDLPTGRYRLYADVTHETGFSTTLTSVIEVADATKTGNGGAPPRDPDDSLWLAGEATDGGTTVDLKVVGDVVAGNGVDLIVSATGEGGHPAGLEPYLGMLCHAVVYKTDGSVYAHLHPSGNISMASQALFLLRESGETPFEVGKGGLDPICEPATLNASADELAAGYGELEQGRVRIPCAFPKAGSYFVWAQVKVDGRVVTGRTRVEVE